MTGDWPPTACPACGNERLEKRYATGGGWRVDHYRCLECGHRTRRDE